MTILLSLITIILFLLTINSFIGIISIKNMQNLYFEKMKLRLLDKDNVENDILGNVSWVLKNKETFAHEIVLLKFRLNLLNAEHLHNEKSFILKNLSNINLEILNEKEKINLSLNYIFGIKRIIISTSIMLGIPFLTFLTLTLYSI